MTILEEGTDISKIIMVVVVVGEATEEDTMIITEVVEEEVVEEVLTITERNPSVLMSHHLQHMLETFHLIVYKEILMPSSKNLGFLVSD